MTDRAERLRHHISKGLCLASVSGGGYYPSHCSRKAVVGEYCKQHDPAAVADKREQREARWNAEREASNVAWNREARLAREYPLIAQEFIDFLESDGRRIEADIIRERIK